MPTKVVFIGNYIGGDDGIGPFLYKELKDEPLLKGFELMELGVIGLDLVSYVGDGDRLIIVDAVRSEDSVGEVVHLKEEDLTAEISLISQHDFGVEETAAVLRAHIPGIKGIDVVGIKAKEIKEYRVGLSPALAGELPRIKKEVVDHILEISKEG